ncbi:MAG: AEC family transporter [Clostridia bacterium]|nr:AEC family transporter [Clostridia bacterium]
MFSFTSLLSTIVTLFLLLATGYIAGRLKIVDETSSKNLSALMIKVGQPFMIINSLIGLEFSFDTLKTGLLVLVLGLGMHVVMAVLAFAGALPVKGLDERKVGEFSMVFTNCGFIGFPILESIFGAEGLFYGAFFIISFHLFTWTWGIAILARKREDIRLTVKKALVNFGTIPSLIGLVLFVSRIPLPEAFTDFSAYLASLCTPIAVIITGANLARRSLKKMLTSPLVYYVNLWRLVIIPLAVTVLLWVLGIPDNFVIFGCVMAAMPTAAVATMFGEMYDIQPGLAAEFVGSTSILCTATLVPVISFAAWLVSV